VRATCVAAALALAACSKRDAAPGAPPPVPVVVALAAEKTIPIEVRAIGRAEPRLTVDVIPQVAGALVGVHFREGQDVKQGDLLFTIDARSYAADQKLAEAEHDRDEARFKQSESDLRRREKAGESGAISAEDLERARAEVEAMRAVAATSAARIEVARLMVERCSIRAPFDSRAGAIRVHPGAVVKENEPPGLVVLNQIRPIDVTFAVPESNLPALRHALAAGKVLVSARSPEDAGVPAAGEVTFLDNAVDLATGTIRLKATFPNDDGRLWPGQFLDARLRLAERAGAVVVPTEALQDGQQGTFVFVVRADATAEARNVVLGPALDGETVVASGLRAGERVVIQGQMRLTPGARVEAKEAAAASRPQTS